MAASGALKKTTGLTGLAVSRTPHHTLSSLYKKILRSLQKLPEDYIYRINTTQIITERLHHVETEKDVGKLERKIGCGQVEELIIQAENELLLSRQMLQWKPWEPLAQTPLPNQWTWPL